MNEGKLSHDAFTCLIGQGFLVHQERIVHNPRDMGHYELHFLNLSQQSLLRPKYISPESPFSTESRYFAYFHRRLHGVSDAQ